MKISLSLKHNTSEVKYKLKESNLINNGVEFPMQSEKIRNKSKQTLMNKYGVDNISKLPENRKLAIDKGKITKESKVLKRFGYTNSKNLINDLIF